ncbi:hypothetical protein [Vibrio astriarenae]|uniref:hypothetical protein n=1 Tax=Vibrio astriarenae TaxID=1481923 RepID=UPI0037362F7E
MIADIHKAFQNLCNNALSIPIKYENTTYTPDSKTTFAFFQLGPVNTTRQSQGQCKWLTYEGEATLTIKVDVKTGVDEAYELADTLIAYALENSLTDGLRLLEPPYVEASEQEFDWLALPVQIPFLAEGNTNDGTEGRKANKACCPNC